MEHTTFVVLLFLMEMKGYLAQGQSQCQPQSEPYVVVPSPHDCRKYLIQCLVGGPIKGECPEGTVFSDMEQKCVQRLSDLDTCTSANAVRECEIGSVDLIPHPTSCQGYFNCFDISPRKSKDSFQDVFGCFLPYEDECTYPDLFDINLRQCVHFDKAKCGNGRVGAKWVCHYKAHECLSSRFKPCGDPSCIGKEDGLWPNLSKLWSPYYIKCLSERAEEEMCDKEKLIGITQLFHPEDRRCQPLWNIPVERGGYKPSCDSKPRGYYEIGNFQIIAYHCPGEEKFHCQQPLSYHYNLTRCTALQEQVPSDDPLCYGKDDGLWPYPSLLWTPLYKRCLSQISLNGEEMCKPEDLSGVPQLFNPEDRQCQPLWNIPRDHGGYKPSCESKQPGYYDIVDINIIAYQCPGEDKFLCVPPLYYHDDITRCIDLQNSSATEDPLCVGKNDGLWPHPTRPWSPLYIRCQSEKSVNTDGKCDKDEVMGLLQVFHPEVRQCQPVWNIPKEHGGYEPNCESKPPGYYETDDMRNITYHCPGEEKFFCGTPLFFHYNLTLCTALQQQVPEGDPLCIGKEDGLWPNPAKLWSPIYVECLSQGVKRGEELCPNEMNMTQTFHPQERKCVPLWDIPREHGGLQSSCESKEPGIYTYDILAYRCPGEMKFLCRPPLYNESNDDDVRRCDPIVEDTEGNVEELCIENCVENGSSVVDCLRYLSLIIVIVGRGLSR